jgi:hypothetical protein
MAIEVDPGELSDRALLEAAQPRGWRAGLRTVGCPVVLAAAGWIAWLVSSAVGARTVDWLGWVLWPFLFLPAGVLFGAVLAVVAGRGSAPLWMEARRRTGQLPLDADLAMVRADLADRAPDQRGWVVLIRGVRSRDRLMTRLRLDLRSDTAPPCGEVHGVRGPRLDTVVSPPDDLSYWERLRKDLPGSIVADLVSQLDAADLGSLPHDRRGRDAGWSGLVIQVGPSANEWTFASRSLPDDSILTQLVGACMATLGWDPTGSPLR